MADQGDAAASSAKRKRRRRRADDRPSKRARDGPKPVRPASSVARRQTTALEASSADLVGGTSTLEALTRAATELRAVAALGEHFRRTTTALGGRKAHAHYEAWLWAARGICEASAPVLPARCAPAAAAELTRKLLLAGVTPESARCVCDGLAQRCASLAAEVDSRAAAAARSVGAGVARAEREGLIDLSACGEQVSCTTAHYAKLRALFRLGGGECEEELAARAFCVLARLLALQGGEERAGGMQGACPPAVFDVLRRDLDVRLELFASPLNARYPRYCSAAVSAPPPATPNDAVVAPASSSPLLLCIARTDTPHHPRRSTWTRPSARAARRSRCAPTTARTSPTRHSTPR